jgi:hypothetical protein
MASRRSSQLSYSREGGQYNPGPGLLRADFVACDAWHARRVTNFPAGGKKVPLGEGDATRVTNFPLSNFPLSTRRHHRFQADRPCMARSFAAICHVADVVVTTPRAWRGRRCRPTEVGRPAEVHRGHERRRHHSIDCPGALTVALLYAVSVPVGALASVPATASAATVLVFVGLRAQIGERGGPAATVALLVAYLAPDLTPRVRPSRRSCLDGRNANVRSASPTEGDDRNRTGVDGFAGRCVATPPRRRELEA